MNLASMRELDHTDPIGGLGPRVTPAPTPAPAPVRRGDGFIVGPDGKLSTDFAPPPGPEVMLCPCGFPALHCASIYCAPKGYPSPAPGEPQPEPEPGAHGFMREPLKVGDRVRVLVGGRRICTVVGAAKLWDGSDGFQLHDSGKIGQSAEGVIWERV